MNTRPRLVSLLALAGSLALPLSAQTVTTLLNDTFSDGERTNQSLPDSAQWLSSSGTGPTVSDNSLSQGSTANGSGATILAYFTAAGHPVTLAVGENLTLSFDVSFANTTSSNGGFRVGLFGSGTGSTRVADDGFGNTNAAFASPNYTGYIVGTNIDATGKIIRSYERNSTSTNLIAGSVSGFTQLGSTGGNTENAFTDGNIYTGTLTITRTDDASVSVSLSYTGRFGSDTTSSTVSSTVVDTSGLTTSFDTVAFDNFTGNAYTLDNIKLDYTSVIPEPSTMALFTGGIVLLAGVLARRRRAA